MKKQDFVSAIAEKTGYTKKDIRAVIDAMGTVVAENIDEDGITVIDGLKVYRATLPAGTFRNPSTGESIEKPERYATKVKVLSALKNIY